MSHVSSLELWVTDLDALEAAGRRLGLDLRRGQETYRWYGRYMGDAPLPTGYGREDLGRCSHALTRTDKPGGYEIGVVPRRDGQPGWALLYDSWDRTLEEVAGPGLGGLSQAYAIEVARRQAESEGRRVFEETLEDGTIALHVLA